MNPLGSTVTAINENTDATYFVRSEEFVLISIS